MAGLSPKTRLWLETIIDRSINNSSESEKMAKELLKDLGIQQNVENSLVFLCGTFYGQALRMEYLSGNVTDESEKEITNILKRRVNELRETYFTDRLNK